MFSPAVSLFLGFFLANTERRIIAVQLAHLTRTMHALLHRAVTLVTFLLSIRGRHLAIRTLPAAELLRFLLVLQDLRYASFRPEIELQWLISRARQPLTDEDYLLLYRFSLPLHDLHPPTLLYFFNGCHRLLLHGCHRLLFNLLWPYSIRIVVDRLVHFPLKLQN